MLIICLNKKSKKTKKIAKIFIYTKKKIGNYFIIPPEVLKI